MCQRLADGTRKGYSLIPINSRGKKSRYKVCRMLRLAQCRSLKMDVQLPVTACEVRNGRYSVSAACRASLGERGYMIGENKDAEIG